MKKQSSVLLLQLKTNVASPFCVDLEVLLALGTAVEFLTPPLLLLLVRFECVCCCFWDPKNTFYSLSSKSV